MVVKPMKHPSHPQMRFLRVNIVPCVLTVRIHVAMPSLVEMRFPRTPCVKFEATTPCSPAGW
jgi:hypothetical protein